MHDSRFGSAPFSEQKAVDTSLFTYNPYGFPTNRTYIIEAIRHIFFNGDREVGISLRATTAEGELSPGCMLEITSPPSKDITGQLGFMNSQCFRTQTQTANNPSGEQTTFSFSTINNFNVLILSYLTRLVGADQLLHSIVNHPAAAPFFLDPSDELSRGEMEIYLWHYLGAARVEITPPSSEGGPLTIRIDGQCNGNIEKLLKLRENPNIPIIQSVQNFLPQLTFEILPVNIGNCLASYWSYLRSQPSAPLLQVQAGVTREEAEFYFQYRPNGFPTNSTYIIELIRYAFFEGDPNVEITLGGGKDNDSGEVKAVLTANTKKDFRDINRFRRLFPQHPLSVNYLTNAILFPIGEWIDLENFNRVLMEEALRLPESRQVIDYTSSPFLPGPWQGETRRRDIEQYLRAKLKDAKITFREDYSVIITTSSEKLRDQLQSKGGILKERRGFDDGEDSQVPMVLDFNIVDDWRKQHEEFGEDSFSDDTSDDTSDDPSDLRETATPANIHGAVTYKVVMSAEAINEYLTAEYHLNSHASKSTAPPLEVFSFSAALQKFGVVSKGEEKEFFSIPEFARDESTVNRKIYGDYLWNAFVKTYDPFGKYRQFNHLSYSNQGPPIGFLDMVLWGRGDIKFLRAGSMERRVAEGFYIFGGFIPCILLNIVRIFTEFLMKLISNSLNFLTDRLSMYAFADWKHDLGAKRFLGVIGYFLLKPLQMLAETTRLLLRTILSPIHSFKAAWEGGYKLFGFNVSGLLAVFSMVLSVSFWTALAFGIGPLFLHMGLSLTALSHAPLLVNLSAGMVSIFQSFGVAATSAFIGAVALGNLLTLTFVGNGLRELGTYIASEKPEKRTQHLFFLNPSDPDVSEDDLWTINPDAGGQEGYGKTPRFTGDWNF